jgi:hypothetical protein
MCGNSSGAVPFDTDGTRTDFTNTHNHREVTTHDSGGHGPGLSRSTQRPGRFPRRLLIARQRRRQGRATVQEVSRRSLAEEFRVRAWVSPCGIYGGRSGNGTGLSLSSSVFPCKYHFTVALRTHISSGDEYIARKCPQFRQSHPIDINKATPSGKHANHVIKTGEPIAHGSEGFRFVVSTIQKQKEIKLQASLQ